MGACCDSKETAKGKLDKTITDPGDSLVSHTPRHLKRHRDKSRRQTEYSTYREVATARRSNPEKTAEDRSLIVSMLQRKSLFADCLTPDLELFINAMSFFELQAEEVIFEEGQPAQYLFILAYGRIASRSQGKTEGKVSRGEEFSMDSFLGETPRQATAIALEQIGLWGLDKESFDQLYQQFKRDEADRLKTYIERAGVFMGLLPEQRESLQEVMDLLRLEADEVVVEQGTVGDTCFIIKAGTVACSKDGQEIRRLGPGELFGEQALMNGGRRTATVRTVTATVLWKIEKLELVFVLGDHLDRIMYRNCVRMAFDGNPILSRLSSQQKEKIITRMKIAVVNKGEEITYKSNQLFVMLQGTFQSTKNPAQILQTFSILGAIAEAPTPHRGEPEHFVVTSDTAAIASIDICTLERRLKGTVSASVGRKPTLTDIKKVPLFTGLSENLLQSLIKNATVRSFSPNEVIINEKDNGNSLFVIVVGEVEVTQQSCPIRTMGILDYFGERALLSNGKRTATVTSKTDTICWSFERAKLPLRSKEESIKEKLLARIALQDDSPQLSDLVVVKHIPVDVPGTPFLVAHSTKLDFYALEVVDKSKLSPANHRDFEWEKQLLLNLYHPFLLRHVKTIDEPRFSYILTVYENGSDLFEVLRDFGRKLTEEEAKFYIACLILVMEFLHRRKICIRNLKPENILIDTSGYPLISSLECSKQLSEKTFTMVGAPHYMAPEMIKRKGYGLEVDYWSLGIMLYESIYGRVPFGEDEQSPMKVYNEILKAELTFPLQTSDQAKDVISSLLEPQPSRRANGSLVKLKKLPWFEGIAWVKPMQDLLMTRKVNAPYKSKGKDMRHMLPKALAKSESIQHAMNVFSR